MKNKFFDLAKKLSKKSQHHSYKMGCVIVNKNKVVSLGINKIKTHTKSPHRFKMLHAEIDAVLGIDQEELKGCTAYVYRGTKDGKPAMSKPCPACQTILKEAGIKQVYYTVDNETGFDYINLKGE